MSLSSKSEKFQAVFGELKSKLANFDASNYQGFLAIQVTLKDLSEEFYIEIKEHKLSVEPYKYDDYQAEIVISADNFVKMINGNLNTVLAFTTGKLKIRGEISKAQELAKLFNR